MADDRKSDKPEDRKVVEEPTYAAPSAEPAAPAPEPSAEPAAPAPLELPEGVARVSVATGTFEAGDALRPTDAALVAEALAYQTPPVEEAAV